MRNARGWSWLAATLVMFALGWMALLLLSGASPPADNIEQMLWSQSLQWGYYKHPPFPTWLYRAFSELLGNSAMTTYIVAAALHLSTLALFWSLVRTVRGRRFAQIALLAVLCITYYNMRFTTLNHNTVLLLVSTLVATLSWHATTSGRMRWWLALGTVLGIGMLTKYQIAVTAACVVAFWLTRSGWRDARQRQGLLAAALVALVLFVPHLQWLRGHDFAPVSYAMDSALGARLTPAQRLLDATAWLMDQLLNRALPAWLLLSAFVMAHRGRRAQPQLQAAEVGRTEDRARRDFLLCWGLVPLLCIPLLGLAAGSHLHLPWGTPHLLFLVPALMELGNRRIGWNTLSLRQGTHAFLLIQATLLALTLLTSVWGPPATQLAHWTNFDSTALACRLEIAIRHDLAGVPLAFVSGPQALAGVLAMRMPERPQVLVDGRADRSPWIDPTRLAHGPVLVVGSGLPPTGATAVGAGFEPLWWRLDITTPSTLVHGMATTPGA